MMVGLGKNFYAVFRLRDGADPANVNADMDWEPITLEHATELSQFLHGRMQLPSVLMDTGETS